MKLVYIAGPYRASTPHGIVQNIRRAEEVAIKYWKKGYAVICPHKNSSLLDGVCEDDVWLKGDIAILSKCDIIVMMKGWEKSIGSANEYKFAIENNIKIIYESKKGY